MSNVSSGHPCIVAFEGHYAKLVESLPTNAMWDMLVSKGLLSDTTLRQSMFAEKTDWGKTRLLLEWMRPGLIVGVNHSFLQLLEVMEEFGRTKNDQAVMKLAENIHKDLPPEAGETRGISCLVPKFHTNGKWFRYKAKAYLQPKSKAYQIK